MHKEVILFTLVEDGGNWSLCVGDKKMEFNEPALVSFGCEKEIVLQRYGTTVKVMARSPKSATP